MISSTYADLIAGDQIAFELPGGRVAICTVLSVEPTGSVKFGEVGPGATPIVRVHLDGMPRPFVGRIEVAADQTVRRSLPTDCTDPA